MGGEHAGKFGQGHDPDALSGLRARPVNFGGFRLTAVQPLLFDMSSVGYFKLGERVANVWNAGKVLKDKD